MRVRKLLDWRKLLIYSHRWLRIAVGAVGVSSVTSIMPAFRRLARHQRTLVQSARRGMRAPQPRRRASTAADA
jgi:hypothetical protein